MPSLTVKYRHAVEPAVRGSLPLSRSHGARHEDDNEQISDTRRADRARALDAGAARRALQRRSASELPRRTRRLTGGLRAYARFRSELRHGRLGLATLERISLAVAEHHGSEQGVITHSRAARAAGLGIDEIALARQFDSEEPDEAALLRYLRALLG